LNERKAWLFESILTLLQRRILTIINGWFGRCSPRQEGTDKPRRNDAKPACQHPDILLCDT